MPRICQRLAKAGEVIERPCPDCDHLMTLHSLHRMCAAREAIVVAEQAARETVERLINDLKPEGPPWP